MLRCLRLRPAERTAPPQLSTLSDFVNAALHVEIAFRYVVVFTFQDFLETANSLSHRHLLALAAGKHLRHAERLTQKALNLARPEHGHLVLGRKLIHAQNRNDVLEVLEALQ